MLYVGKGGFYEGRANGEQGWFPRNTIKIHSPKQIQVANNEPLPITTVPVNSTDNGIKVSKEK